MENYFNYFTEIEECFRRCRGTPTLLSPLDWALIESWKEAGLPLEAVLIGIERSFEKFQKRPQRFRKVNSLAYCSQEVLRAAEEASTKEVEGGKQQAGGDREAPPFEAGEVRSFIGQATAALERAAKAASEKGERVLAEDLASASESLKGIAPDNPDALGDLESLENNLSALEEKVTAALMRSAPVERIAELRAEVEKGLAPYRRKMAAGQIESLERQFLKKRLFEYYGVPRLSLFYL